MVNNFSSDLLRNAGGVFTDLHGQIYFEIEDIIHCGSLVGTLQYAVFPNTFT